MMEWSIPGRDGTTGREAGSCACTELVYCMYEGEASGMPRAMETRQRVPYLQQTGR
jgi:hypothetical protein